MLKTRRFGFWTCRHPKGHKIHPRPTALKVSKYGVFSGPYFPACGPEKTPYVDTFYVAAICKKHPQSSTNYRQFCNPPPPHPLNAIRKKFFLNIFIFHAARIFEK